MVRIRKFFCLPAEEKVIFLRALFLLVYVRFSLQFKQFKNVVKDVSNKAASQNSVQKNSILPSRVAHLLNAAGNTIPYTTCLPRALAGSILLSSLGYQTKLHIGVTRKDGSMLEAHAWLTLNGSVIVGYRSDLDCYQQFNQDTGGS
ncbi:MAG: lasso peptide biosynthesis B2 protein [Proteobacteria bacterium]|nr:lasso peptide biosynthesis B2 protein [Pseudomonadota bacterium]